MMKRIVAGASVGWAGVVGLTWWLAHLRIEICSAASSSAEANCAVRATAARDDVLTSGLTVALVAAILAALAWSMLKARHGGGRMALSVRPAPPSPRIVESVTASLTASFIGLSRPQRALLLLSMFGALAAPALLLWAATDAARPAASIVAVNSADNYEFAADNLEMMADTPAEDTYSPGEVSLEQDTPTSDQLDAATLLEEAADRLERAEQEPEPTPDEAEASEDEPIADAEAPAAE